MFGDSCLSDLAKRHNMRIVAVGPEPFLAKGLEKKSVHGKNQRINIKTDMKQIGGVIDAAYNYDTMTLAIYYDEKADLNLINILVMEKIDSAMLHNAISKINFYSVQTPAKLAGSGPKRAKGKQKVMSPTGRGLSDVPTLMRAGQLGQPAQGVDQGHVLTKVGRRGRGGSGILHFRSNLHGPARVSAIGKLWVLNSSGKRFTVCTNGGEIIQRDTIWEALAVLVGDVLAAGGKEYKPVICHICGEIDRGNPCDRCSRDLEEARGDDEAAGGR